MFDDEATQEISRNGKWLSESAEDYDEGAIDHAEAIYERGGE